MRVVLGASAVVCFALLGCRGDAPAPAPAPSTASLEVESTPRGGQLVRDVHRRFRDKDKRTPFLDHPGVQSFRREGDMFVAMATAPKGKTPITRVSLPAFADLGANIGAGELAITIKPRVAHTAAEWAQHLAVHPDVAPGVTLFRRVDQDGLDDVYEVSAPTETLRFTYDLTLGNAKGLRLVDGTLEILDEKGTPRVRVPAPELVDSKGLRRVGAIGVNGCAFDRDPRGPWGRAVVAPGAESCEVVATIDGRGLSYPVLVDPAWVGTANTKATHAWHKMVKIAAGADAGKVLVLGGTGSLPTQTELYDVTSGTWAVSSTLPDTLTKGVNAVALSNGSVVVAGGFPASTTAAAKSNTYVRSATGTWTAGASMSGGRAWFAMSVMTIDAKEVAFVAGGMQAVSIKTSPVKTAEYYDAATDSWFTAPSMSEVRSHPGYAVLSDGRLMVAGGHGLSGGFAAELTSVEIFSPTSKTWTTGGSLATERSDAVLVPVAGGGAVLAGGWNDFDYTLASIEHFNGTAWSTLPVKMTEPRMFHIGAALADGRILLAAGNVEYDDPIYAMTASGTADILELGTDPKTTAKINGSGGMSTSRIAPAWIVLGDKVLVTGGQTSDVDGTETTSSELFDTSIGAKCTGTCPAGLFCTEGVCCKSSSCPEGQTCAAPGSEGICTKPKGSSCTSNTECATGFCVTGICCSTACTGDCQTCNVAGKVGECANAAVGTDPKKVCGGDPTCGPFCDSFGDCFEYATTGTKCGASLGDAGTGSFCAAYSCNDWGDCEKTTNNCGLTCTTSVSCDESTKTCTAIASGIKAGKCVIDGQCWDYGEINPKNACQLCDPPSSKTTWSTAASCMDGGVDTGTTEDTGTPDDTGAVEDTGTTEDTGTAEDTGTTPTDDATADTGSTAADLPEASTCGCRTPGGDAPSGGAMALIALLVAASVRKRTAR
jgi:MYXO-CTERM domain-containing protein